MLKPRTIAAALCALSLLSACQKSSPRKAPVPAARVEGTLHSVFIASLALDPIGSVRFDVFQGGALIDTQTIHLASIVPPGGGAERPGGDFFFVVPPGTYDVIATPLDDAGNPSPVCSIARGTAVVTVGKTTEVVLTIFCDDRGTGGLDVVVIVEHRPVITNLELDPGKFIRTCEQVLLKVTARDLDGDPLAYHWSVAESPPGAVFQIVPNGDEALFLPETAGDYLISIEVTDPGNHVAGLSLPIHVSKGPLCDGADTAEVLTVLVEPVSVQGGEFPPFDVVSEGRNDEEGEGNEDVPIGPLRGDLKPVLGGVGLILPQQPGPLAPGGGGIGDSVQFFQNTAFGNRVSFSGVPPDMSGASGGRVVLATGNTFGALSTDSGASFNAINPTTIFPSGPTRDAAGILIDGGLCCDQVVQYAPQIDRFIWLMQFWGPVPGTLGGPNMLRIASASPADIINSGGTAWTYWDLRSATFGLGSSFMDYPDMSVGNNNLYLSVDQVGTGLLVLRIPLSQIQLSQTIFIDYTNPALSAVAYGGHLTQNTGDEIFWAGHNNTSQMRVFSLHEGSNTYFWRNVNVNSWPNSDYSSIAPNGVDWLAFGFPRAAVIGAARRNAGGILGGAATELWFAWMAARGGGFPHPHVQIAVIDASDYHLMSQVQVWNGDFAFAYPCLATNTGEEIGMSLAFGGGVYHGNHAVGFWGDFVVYPPALSDNSINRWGDYVTIRRASPDPSQFSAVGYHRITPAGGSTRFDPHYVLFGRPPIIIR